MTRIHAVHLIDLVLEYLGAESTNLIAASRTAARTSINARLKEVLLAESRRIPPEEIEKRSSIQKRGRLSTPATSSTVVLAETTVRGKTSPKKRGGRSKKTDQADLFPDFV